jgi:hypothetical protein
VGREIITILTKSHAPPHSFLNYENDSMQENSFTEFLIDKIVLADRTGRHTREFVGAGNRRIVWTKIKHLCGQLMG